MSIIDALGCVLMLAKSPHIRSSEKGKREFELSGRKKKESRGEMFALQGTWWIKEMMMWNPKESRTALRFCGHLKLLHPPTGNKGRTKIKKQNKNEEEQINHGWKDKPKKYTIVQSSSSSYIDSRLAAAATAFQSVLWSPFFSSPLLHSVLFFSSSSTIIRDADSQFFFSVPLLLYTRTLMGSLLLWRITIDKVLLLVYVCRLYRLPRIIIV